MNREQKEDLLAVMDDAYSGLQAEVEMRKDRNILYDEHPDYWSLENLEKAASQVDEARETLKEEIEE